MKTKCLALRTQVTSEIVGTHVHVSNKLSSKELSSHFIDESAHGDKRLSSSRSKAKEHVKQLQRLQEKVSSLLTGYPPMTWMKIQWLFWIFSINRTFISFHY